MEIKIQDIEHIAAAAREFIQHIGDSRVFAFYGQMGAGKTTFIKAVCEQLGVTDVVTSPTFAIVNVYTIAPSSSSLSSGSGRPSARLSTVYHFDLYRIKRLEEVYDMGYEDYFYDASALCFIEWPELAEELLPPGTVSVTLQALPDGSRQITVDAPITS